MTFFPKSNMAGFTEGLPQGINKGGCPLLTIKKFGNIFPSKNITSTFRGKNVIDKARMYLQLPLRQWGAGNVYLLVLSS